MEEHPIRWWTVFRARNLPPFIRQSRKRFALVLECAPLSTFGGVTPLAWMRQSNNLHIHISPSLSMSPKIKKVHTINLVRVSSFVWLSRSVSYEFCTDSHTHVNTCEACVSSFVQRSHRGKKKWKKSLWIQKPRPISRCFCVYCCMCCASFVRQIRSCRNVLMLCKVQAQAQSRRKFELYYHMYACIHMLTNEFASGIRTAAA